MISEGEIVRALGMLINGKVTGAFTAKVTKNDKAESDGYVEVVYNDLTYNPKLKSVLDQKDKHLISIPKVGSKIFCVSEGNSQERFIAIAFNEIEKLVYSGENLSFLVDDVNKKIEAVIGSISFRMSESEIKLNDGIKNSYMADLNKVVEKYNAIEQDINSLKQVISGWMPVANDGGAALKTAAGSWAGQAIAQTIVNDLKDEKIRN